MKKLLGISKKQNKNYIFLGVAGIIIIAIFFFFLKKDRFDEYSCLYQDGGGPEYISIENKIFNSFYKDKLKIQKETSDRVIAVKWPDRENKVIWTLYKRTKILKIEYPGLEKTEPFILNCTQLN